jgi:general secretion pathway protein G
MRLPLITPGKSNINVRVARLRRRALGRGVTLVEVLIVVAIMAIIAGGAVFVGWPEYRKAQVKTAITGASAVRAAAQTYVELDTNGGDACPTIQDLVNAKKLEKGKTDDPWGTPYKVECADGEIHIRSFGRDKKENTGDDVRDDTKLSDVERIANGPKG